MATDAAPTNPDELFGIDALLSDEERAIRDSVRALVQARVVPNVQRWYEHGDLPVRKLALELGKIGVLGMHLHGYGCSGTSSLAYGLACMELEAGDSGIRSLVSVQGRWRCMPSMPMAVMRRSRSGCPGWQRAKSWGVSV